MQDTPISAILDRLIDDGIKLSPMEATYMGIPGYDDQLDDLSPVGEKKREELVRNALAAVKAEAPVNEFDRIAKEVAIERLSSELKLSESKESHATFNLIASPVTGIRQIFEMMKDSPDLISNVTKRLNAIQKAFDGWRETIEVAAKEGKVNAKRQVLATAGQLDTFANGGFTAVAKKFNPALDNAELVGAAKNAEKACAELATWLREKYAPISQPEDGVGENRYKLWARHFTGADLNIRETYEWGVQELQRINDRMWVAAKKLYPDATTLREVADRQIGRAHV